IQGVPNLLAVRSRVQIPVIGLIKRDYDGFDTYITPTIREVTEIIASGADVVAFDATGRRRPGGTTPAELVDVIHASGRLAMADCSSEDDAAHADAFGADIVATTLCGYTEPTKGASLPALDLVARFRRLRAFAVCEGGIASPAQLKQAFEAGADAVVVGTAITNVDALVGEFAARADKKKHR
ncbi:MAG: putative N-acetylmannosamine-6-phosphate 2-epimerase, partial [Candidatus Eremiobacteraeota bacterium]|nr:putative N-acetylmannosamine-6-phosphate 2-epimerase [Candidatus Eremiobacteraeota bacterium]